MHVHYDSITTAEGLRDYCRELARCQTIALDSEFVSEHTYRPVLCLIQVSAAGRLALIDALSVDDLVPFWEAVAAPGHETVMHAGRGEAEFCLAATGRLPAGLFDVQVAAGLAGVEYPAGYATLIARLLGEASPKHETRTDWRRRPLSQRQLMYALEDVQYLPVLRDLLHARLERLKRLDWMAEEMADWQEQLQRSASEERWWRVSGNSGLDARSLAIVRELYHWRQSEARRRNVPPRRVLRDDLIIELARRQTAELNRIRAVRGLERGDLQRRLGEIAECIHRALSLPDEECPRRSPRESVPQLSVLGQFLFAALGSVCRQAEVAPGLAGNPNDIRELIAFRLVPTLQRGNERPPPKLARGWREQLIGRLFHDLLAGRTAIRIGDPQSEHPLVFEGETGA